MRGYSLNIRVLNVTLIFFSAYLIIHVLYLYLVYFCASFIGVQELRYYFSYISYDLVAFQGWSRLKISILYGLPTLLLPVFAGLFWIAKEKFSFGDNPKIKLFYLSLILCALSFFIADFVIAPFKRQGVALVAEWFYFKKETILIGSLLFWTIIPIAAWVNAKSFMKLANSRTYLRTKWSRMAFIATSVIQPFIFASIVISLMIIFVPAYSVEHFLSLDFIRMAVMFLILIFIMLFNFNKKYIGVKKQRQLERINTNFLVITIATAAIFYTVLYF